MQARGMKWDEAVPMRGQLAKAGRLSRVPMLSLTSNLGGSKKQCGSN